MKYCKLSIKMQEHQWEKVFYYEQKIGPLQLSE